MNPADQFLKYYIGNEINPKFESFLRENLTWKAFFKKYKKDFTEIKDRLVEFSKKIGLSVGEFKKLVSRIQKGERESRIAKKEMVEANFFANSSGVGSLPNSLIICL